MTLLVSGRIMYRGVPEYFFLDQHYRPVDKEILDGGDGDDSGNINENIKRTDLNIIKVTQRTEMKEIDGYEEGSRGGISRSNCESNCCWRHQVPYYGRGPLPEK